MPQDSLSIVVQALDFGPALCGVLGFVALTGWMLWFRFGDLFGDARRQVTILAIAGILGLGFIGYLGLGFALAGWFSASRFFGVWALVMMLLAADGWRRGRWPAHLAQWRFAQPLPIYFWLLISLWLLLYIRPFDLVIGGRDPGVYVNTAAQIAEQGGLAVLDPFLADLTPAIQEQLVWHPVWLKDFIPYKWPGFFWMGNSSARPGMVLPQFFHMYPALMAPFYAMLGYRGALTILPVIMLVFALVLAEMAWLLLQPRLSGRDELAEVTPPSLALTIGSLLPPLFLLLNPAMYWFGRFANADVLYGLFVFAAVFFWARAAEVRNQGWLNWPLALLCFGAALLTKIDSFYLLPGAVLTAQVFHPARRERHRWAQWLAWGAVCGVYLAAVYGFSYPYVLSTLRSSGFWVSTQRAEAVWIAIGYLMIVTAAGLTTPLLAADRLERWRTRWRLPAASLALAVAVACLLSLTILVVAMPNRVRLVVALDVLLAYVPWPVLLAGLAGIVLLVLRVRERMLALPLLGIFFSSGLFILLQTNIADHPWSERRATSIALPFLMLCAGIAVAEAFRWALPVIGTGDLPRRFGPIRGTIRHLVALVILAAALVPMAGQIPTIFWHQEADGARNQLRLLDSLFPSNAVIFSEGARAIEFFGPGLSIRGGREILSSYDSTTKPQVASELTEKIGDAALAAGRPFFFVMEGDAPPGGRFLWARVWWGEWILRRMVGKDHPQPLTLEFVPVPYRIYRAVGIVVGGVPSADQVRVYEAEALPSQTGRLVTDVAAGNGWGRVAEAGRDVPGALVFGPYVKLPAGDYTARFLLRASGDVSAAPSTLLVMGEDGRRLAEQQIGAQVTGTYSELEMPFALERSETVEFSVIFGGAGLIWLDRVELLPASQVR